MEQKFVVADGGGNLIPDYGISLRRRLMISIILMLLLFYMSFGESAGLPMPGLLYGIYDKTAFTVTNIVITAIIIALNRHWYSWGFKDLAGNGPNLATLVAMGSAVSFICSIFSEESFLGSAGAILTIATLGKYTEAIVLRGKIPELSGISVLNSNDRRIATYEDVIKEPRVLVPERSASFFISLVIILAMIVVLLWMIAGETSGSALMFGISVLLIACPSALSLSPRISAIAGKELGAKNSVIFKNGKSYEKASGIDLLFLDKKLSITNRKKSVVLGAVMPGMTKMELFSVAAAISSVLEGPIPEAIVNLAKAKNLMLRTPDSVDNVSGLNAKALLGGKEYLLGSLEFLEQNGVECRDAYEAAENFISAAATPVILSCEGRLMGAIGIADEIKQGFLNAVSEIKSIGIAVVMFTDDNETMAEILAGKLGITKAIPIDSSEESGMVKAVAAAAESGHKFGVAGDLMKNFRGMGKSDLRIAIGSDNDLGSDPADITILEDEPANIAVALRIGRSVIKNLKSNLWVTFIYNILAILIAAGVPYHFVGLRVDPMAATAIMSLFSLFTVVWSLRIKGTDPASGSKIQARV